MPVSPSFWVPVFVVGLVHVSPASGQGLDGGSRLMAVSWTDPASGHGMVRGFSTSAPFGYETPPLVVGADSVLRYALGRVYAVSSADDTITVIDPGNPWAIEQVYSLGAGSEPKDIAVVGPRTAYVTRGGSAQLLRLDLLTGNTEDAADFGPFADPDGNPDMAMMILHEGRLFVQLRRFDPVSYSFVTPAMLAVVDASTGGLIDADPVQPGVQAIELVGMAPKGKMQIVPSLQRLFCSATGDFFDAGGIETVDLDTLQSAGMVIEEADGQTGAELGPFVMVQPDRGYLVFSTDFALSSHLFGFSVPGGVDSGSELHISLGYFAPVLAHDPNTDTLFVPQAGISPSGVQVFDAATGAPLTSDAIPTSGPPVDLQLVYTGCGAGDLNGDGDIDAADLAILLSAWGPCEGCPADFNGDAVVDAADLAEVLGARGMCP